MARRWGAALAGALLVGVAWVGGIAGLAAAPGGVPGDGLPEEVVGMEFVARVSHSGGAGVWLDPQRDYAYSSALNGGFFVTDISDPANPVKVGSLGSPYMRDADFVDLGARKVVVAAANSAGLRVVEVTDPTQPTLLATIDVGTTHNLAAIPGTTLVYGARGGTGGGTDMDIDIFDVADPARPRLVKTWTDTTAMVTAPSCHDLTIYVEVGRAYCAGGGQSVILDIADPLNPVPLGVVNNELISFHHWALANQDHTLLILGDEAMGSTAPGCIASVTTPLGTVSVPTGAIWFYDISDPSDPKLLSWVSPPFTGTLIPCTAHFGEVIADRALLAVGWYRGGIVLLDFSDPVLPRIVDQWLEGSDPWDVRYRDGHLFTGDIVRGMDVLRLVGPGEAAAADGAVAAGTAAPSLPEAQVQALLGTDEDAPLPYSCRIDGPAAPAAAAAAMG